MTSKLIIKWKKKQRVESVYTDVLYVSVQKALSAKYLKKLYANTLRRSGTVLKDKTVTPNICGRGFFFK